MQRAIVGGYWKQSKGSKAASTALCSKGIGRETVEAQVYRHYRLSGELGLLLRGGEISQGYELRRNML